MVALYTAVSWYSKVLYTMRATRNSFRTHFNLISLLSPSSPFLSPPLSRKYRINKDINMSSEYPFNILKSTPKDLSTQLIMFVDLFGGCYCLRNDSYVYCTFSLHNMTVI